MSTQTTYNRREKIGNLNQRVAIYTPTYQRNTIGGEKPKWVLWTTVFMSILPIKQGSSEQMITDQVTAVKKRQFRCRKLSANGLNETQILRIDGDDYDIDYIEPDPTENRPIFSIIHAIRKRQNITPVTVLDDSLAMDYSQTFTNQSTNTLLVTAGTLPDPGTQTADYFHQMVHVYRSGLRMVYGSTTADGYSVSGNNLVFVQKLRSENVLLHQYQTAGS